MIATDASAPRLDDDDRLLLDELRARGVRARPVVWDDEEFDWTRTRLCVIRATRDYELRAAEFLRWAARVAQETWLLNGLSALRWNVHKFYLRDLERSGTPIVPTEFLSRGAATSLAARLDARGWSRAVVKPAVSASARETFRVDRGRLDAGEARFAALLAREDLLVQKSMEGVEEEGGLSIVYVCGVYSHAVRLRPAPDDFRVQAEHGGSTELVAPRSAELIVAHHVIESGPAGTLHARVDLLTDGDGEPKISGYELIEPRLHLAHSREAVRRLAAAVEGCLEHGSRGAAIGARLRGLGALTEAT